MVLCDFLGESKKKRTLVGTATAVLFQTCLTNDQTKQIIHLKKILFTACLRYKLFSSFPLVNM